MKAIVRVEKEVGGYVIRDEKHRTRLDENSYPNFEAGCDAAIKSGFIVSGGFAF